MSRGALLVAAVAGLGAALVLAELRWFRRPRLVDRLLPYLPGRPAGAPPPAAGLAPLAAARQLAAPLAQQLGARAARAFGVREDLAVRLERVHARDDATAFRLRQLGWALVGLALGAAATVVLRPPPALALLLLVGGPLLAFLLVEHRLARASAAWQRRVFLELPVTCEQLGMLLSAGWSLGGALDRLARRGRGACARDLARVCARVRQGLGEVDALREWAAVADVDALHRLVGVLALNREASDLGRLIADEARAVRQEVQRQLIEAVERRGQQVWVPVTVATLVPGVIFLAVPFVEAMRLFSSG